MKLLEFPSNVPKTLQSPRGIAYETAHNARKLKWWASRQARSSSLLSSLELSDTKVYEPQIRALLGTASHFCKVVVLKSSRQARSGERDAEVADMLFSFKVRAPLPWRKAGPSNHHDDKVDSDQ